jgi:hypothetical protein
MLFGDSYKKWQTQFSVFIRIRKSYNENPQVLKVERSNSKWKGFGGLKWCSSESFQQELNREDVQQGEPDNPNARQYADMKFYEFDIDEFYNLISKNKNYE